jgi:Tol biopolymer transport system component
VAVGPHGGRVETVGADGGSPHVVAPLQDSCCEPLAWAADDRIVDIANFTLQAVAATGGRPKSLSKASTPWFLLSPDRQTIAYDDGCACGHAADSIGLVAVAGGKPFVVPRPKNTSDSIDGFSPDGTELTFTRFVFHDEQFTKPVHMAVPVRGGKAVPLAQSGIVGGSALPADARQAQWSPDGRWVAFVTWVPYRLELVSTAGGPPRVLVPFGFGSFAWAPDSKHLAYVLHGRGPNAVSNDRLATVDLQGHRHALWSKTNGLHYLTRDSGLAPQWSPDGTKLVFTAIHGNDGPPAQIWVVGADGTGLKKIL